jgi:ssDNA thymidine ADP-ribosyltransferase, DarT
MSTLIYHITHLRNLQSIIKAGGLMAKTTIDRQQIGYEDIAHQGIQDRRATVTVPYGAGGVLHDYVPFYFAPRSPMLCAINMGNVVGYQEGQASVIHLVCEAESISSSKGIEFVFTDGHAIMGYSTFYTDLNVLCNVIDWNLMQSKYWFDTPDDPNRKCRRQAEFLIHQFCPWTLIREIGVINSQIKVEVEELLQNENHCPPVKVYSGWYY